MKRTILTIVCVLTVSAYLEAADIRSARTGKAASHMKAAQAQFQPQVPADQGPSTLQTVMGLMATAALANLVDQQLTQRASAFSKEYPTLMFNLGIVLTLIMPKLLSENNAIKHLFYNSLGLWKVNDAMKSSEGIIELMKAAGRSAGIIQ